MAPENPLAHFLLLSPAQIFRKNPPHSTGACRRESQMSLFGAMSTAISGLNAQSAAFSNISNNVANSQTVGYKEVNTSFIDYLTNSTAAENDSGSVVTRPDYANNVPGTI